MDLDSFFVPTNSLVACARKEGKESQKEIQTSWKLGYVKDCVLARGFMTKNGQSL